MKKRMMYVTPTVKVTRVILEKGIAVNSSPIYPNGIQVYDWEPQAETQGDIWIPI